MTIKCTVTVMTVMQNHFFNPADNQRDDSRMNTIKPNTLLFSVLRGCSGWHSPKYGGAECVNCGGLCVAVRGFRAVDNLAMVFPNPREESS